MARTHGELLSSAFGASRVRSVWLTGSSMLGDLTQDSDIDTVTLTNGFLGPEDEQALARIHAVLAEQFPGARYDTTYLDVGSLAHPPKPGLVVQQSIDGELILDQPGGEVHPVTWFTLPDAIPIIGHRPVDVEIAADLEAARAHSCDNLRSYWVGVVVHGIRTALSGRPPATSLEHPGTVGWVVLGAPRLVMFLDPEASYAGPIPSKSEAGRWVISHRPEYADLARRALAARASTDAAFTVADALSAADLVDSLVS